MLTSSTRIGILMLLTGALMIMGESTWLLWRGKKKLPLKRSLTLTGALSMMSAGELIYAANGLVEGSLWFYLANAAGILFAASAAIYAMAMKRSLALPD